MNELLTGEVVVYGLGGVATGGDATDYEGGTGGDVAGGEYLRVARLAERVDLDIAAGILFEPEHVNYALRHRICETHGEKYEFGLDGLRLTSVYEIHAAGFGIFLPLDLFHDHLLDTALLVRHETARVEKPSALAAFEMAARSLENHRIIRPGGGRIFAYGRFWHNFNLSDRARPLATGGADAIAAGVTATYDKYILILGRNSVRATHFGPGVDAVLLLKKLKGKMHAFQLASLHLEIAGHLGSHRKADGIKFIEQTFDSYVITHLHSASELNALLSEKVETAVNHALVELEIGYAEAEKSAGCLVFLKHNDRVAAAVELIGAGESGWSRAHDSHTEAGALPGRTGFDIALAESALHDSGLVLADGYGLMLLVEHTALLAESGTDAARELREVVGLSQQLVSALDVIFVKAVLPFGLTVAERTTPVAERNSALHAARSLQAAVLGVESLLYLTIVVDAVMDGTIARLLARYI